MGFVSYGRCCVINSSHPARLEVELVLLPRAVVGEAAVGALAKGCPRLAHLQIYNSCGLLTDAAVIALAKCPLTTLNLGHAKRLTDAAVVQLASKRPGLTYLSLVGSTLLTDAAIEALSSSCPELRRLRLAQCPRLTDEALRLLEQGCPKLGAKPFRWEMSALR